MLDDKGQLLHHYGRYMEHVRVEQNQAPVDRNQIITRIIKLIRCLSLRVKKALCAVDDFA